jgi:hypothetical protein
MIRKLNELLQDKEGPLPVWIRPPKSGCDYWCGLSRSKLYLLAQERKIRSASIREPGQIKGTRLFELRSILDFIERSADSTDEESAQ